MRTIWKFELELHSAPTEILLPEGSIVRYVSGQNHVVCVWVELTDDPVVPKQMHKFYVVGTGHKVPDDANCGHVGTAFVGPFVWHVYHGI